MEPSGQLQVSLNHHVEVGQAANFLLHELGCDNWHVACRREHLLVLHLNRGQAPRFAVTFECTAPVEKGVYHETKASALRLIPLHGEDAPSEDHLLRIHAHFASLN